MRERGFITVNSLTAETDLDGWTIEKILDGQVGNRRPRHVIYHGRTADSPGAGSQKNPGTSCELNLKMREGMNRDFVERRDGGFYLVGSRVSAGA
jgi:hypothetical protein